MYLKKIFLSETSKAVLYPAVFSSILLEISMPGDFGWWLLLFVALVPLFRAILYNSPCRSFLTGLLTGFFYYTILLYWIVIVLSQYGGLPVWMAVGALLLLSIYMSLYLAVFCFLTSIVSGRYWQKERPIGTLVFIAPFIWVGLDWVRSLFFTAFPWMDLAYGLYKQLYLIQAADLGGHHLITLCIVLVNCLVLYIFEQQQQQVHWNIRFEKRMMMLLCSFLVFVGGYSYLRFNQMSQSLHKGFNAQVSVIQGNIEQDDKWTAENKTKTVKKYIDLSTQALNENMSELVVWPETAMPFFLQQDQLFRSIGNFVKNKNIWLLTGAPFFSQSLQENQKDLKTSYYNSAVLVNPDGIILQRYDKMHLVPFGEYVPMRKALPFLEPLVHVITDFTPGEAITTLSFGSLKLGVLICFESIFPDLARTQTELGANLLVNLTNDAWYGRSSAPYQTLAMSVFRSIENRRSLVRAANTGISCFIDPLGAISHQSEIFISTHLTSKVPILENLSVYNRFGYHFGVVCFSISFAFLLFCRWRK